MIWRVKNYFSVKFVIAFYSTFPRNTAQCTIKRDHDFCVKINTFTKVTKDLISRNFFSVIVFCSTFPYLCTVHSALLSHCGKDGNLLSRFFGKNFVKTPVLLIKLLNRQLIWRNTFCVRVNYSFFHTVALLWPSNGNFVKTNSW